MRQDILQAGESARRSEQKGASRVWIGLAVLLLLGNLGWYMTWNSQVKAQQAQAQTLLCSDMADAAQQAQQVMDDPTDTQAYYRVVAALRGASQALGQLNLQTDSQAAADLWDVLLTKPEHGVQQMALIQKGTALLAQDWQSVEGYQTLAAASMAISAQ